MPLDASADCTCGLRNQRRGVNSPEEFM
jgi:hypothetical protein